MSAHERPSLPIDELLPDLVDGVRRCGVAVLRAATGAGKTTRVPAALLSVVAPEQQVLVVEPRRIAARAAATRVAEELGVDPGTEVGYRIRFENRSSKSTRLLYLTEGVLLSRLQADPFLEGVGAVVFDEFHERRLDSDLALALCRQVRAEARRDVSLVVMSATLDPDPLVRFLAAADDATGAGDSDVPVLESAGRLHPVEVRYLERPDDRPLVSRVEAGVLRALGEQEGSVLAFLPGVGEIRTLEKRLGDRLPKAIRVCPLYGDLSPERQHAALRGGGDRRVVLATNVAETSVTVEGVVAVVDCGYARVMRYDAASGLDRLELRRISRASAEQRCGRAGREGPGIGYRLWTESEQSLLPERETPEVQRVDLSSALLQLAVWGEADPLGFDWFEPPDRARAERALELLRELGAIDRSGGSTARGRGMSGLPLHPRLARLLLDAREVGEVERAALAAALLEERDLFRPSGVKVGGGVVGPAVPETRSDLLDRVEAIEQVAAGRRDPRVTRGRVAAVRRSAERILRAVDRAGGSAEATPPEDDRFLRLLLGAYPDRVARRREPGSDRAVMVGGRGLRQAPDSGVRSPPLYLALRVGGSGAEGTVFLASEVAESWLPAETLREDDVVGWDEQRERAVAARVRFYRDLEIDRREIPVSAEAAAELLATKAGEDPFHALGVDRSSDGDAVASLLARLEVAREMVPEAPLPSLDEDALGALLPALCQGRSSFADLRRAPLLETLRGQLGWETLTRLDRIAPPRVELGNGRSVAVRYRTGEPPLVAATIQTFFGVANTPTVGDGRVPVLLHLLAPNQRPQQVTRDLASFWANTYAEVRKELAGRYPKHSWPARPQDAEPPPQRGPRRSRRH